MVSKIARSDRDSRPTTASARKRRVDGLPQGHSDADSEGATEDDVGPIRSGEDVFMEDPPQQSHQEDPPLEDSPQHQLHRDESPEPSQEAPSQPESATQAPSPTEPSQQAPSQPEPATQEPAEQFPSPTEPSQQAPSQPEPAAQDPPPPQPAEQFPSLLRNFETHIAQLIWAQASLDPPQNVVRNLRVQTRPTQVAFWRDHIPIGVPAEGTWFWIAQQTGLTGLLDFQFGNVDHNLISAFVER